jgi:hypothetical protein
MIDLCSELGVLDLDSDLLSVEQPPLVDLSNRSRRYRLLFKLSKHHVQRIPQILLDSPPNLIKRRYSTLPSQRTHDHPVLIRHDHIQSGDKLSQFKINPSIIFERIS